MKVSNADAAVAALQEALDRASRRSEAVASNLANVDTPGYRALDVEFFDRSPFAAELQRTRIEHLSHDEGRARQGALVEAPVTRVREDGNTVDVDREMTLLAALQGRYRASAEMLRKRFGLWLYAVTDGRSGG
jgi:flagellar basal-body rod protein FlgB